VRNDSVRCAQQQCRWGLAQLCSQHLQQQVVASMTQCGSVSSCATACAR
jgi:hypothetical protein